MIYEVHVPNSKNTIILWAVFSVFSVLLGLFLQMTTSLPEPFALTTSRFVQLVTEFIFKPKFLALLFAARVITDRETSRSRGFGFVTFEDSKAFERALDLNGQVMVILCGKKLFFS